MIWTILILVLAIALFAGGELLFANFSKKEMAPIVHWAKKGVNLISIIMLVIGINRMGMGTKYYLVDYNPMILQDMAQNMQSQGRSQGMSSREIRRILRQQGNKLTQFAPVMGNPDAKKTIVLFTVPTCPFCLRIQEELNRVVADRDDVRVVIKAFSIHGVRSDASVRAMIAATLQSNEKAVALTKALKDDTGWLEGAANAKPEDLANAIHKGVMEVAKKVGLDTEKLAADMNGPAVREEMANVRDLAGKLQVQGTPFLIIENRAYPGAIPYDQIMQALR
jgi:protein-disulfide isomerase